MEWTKTSERVPEEGKPVLVYIPAVGGHGASMKVLMLNDSHLWVDTTAFYYPEKTFWMPLPEAPKEVEE